MCEDHDHVDPALDSGVGGGLNPTLDASHDPVLAGRGWRPSRRSFLAGTAGGAVGLMASGFLPTTASAAARASAPTPFAASGPLRTAMHVHGSWSEGHGSWESQFAQAAGLGLDVLYMTDHDFRAEAHNYLTSLAGAALVAAKTGSLTQGSLKNTNGTVRVVAESSTSGTASYGAAVQPKPLAFNRLRTSIAGHTVRVTFAAARVDSGGMYEIVVTLSNHPAFGNHVVGTYELHYRFGAFTRQRFVEPNGFVGVVTAPTPSAGTQTTLDLVADVSALWPDLLAFDNSFYGLELRATSPRKGAVVDVSASVAIARSQNDPAALSSLQQQVIDAYAPRHPGLTTYRTTEISRLTTHIIPFGVPQFWTPQSSITTGNIDAAYTAIADSVHQQGGLVSWNHPFGAQNGPLLSAAEMVATRRAQFALMTADGRDHTDILEVGYAVRGHVNTQTHIDLWDTFSRNGMFVTGNGVNDDHQGLHWGALSNGFTTGIWADSASQADLVKALASGRVYTYHPGKWTRGQLDTMVDGSIAMGKVSVGTAATRRLDVLAANLPSGAVAQVVRGPVDFTGNDPGTTTIARLNAAGFSGSGVQSVTVDTSQSCFVRVQILNSAGGIIGIGNPTWLLRADPPGGVPAPRRP